MPSSVCESSASSKRASAFSVTNVLCPASKQVSSSFCKFWGPLLSSSSTPERSNAYFEVLAESTKSLRLSLDQIFSSFPPLSLDVSDQPEGIVLKPAVLGRSHLCFRYVSTQRCDTVRECREPLFSPVFCRDLKKSRVYLFAARHVSF